MGAPAWVRARWCQRQARRQGVRARGGVVVHVWGVCAEPALPTPAPAPAHLDLLWECARLGRHLQSQPAHAAIGRGCEQHQGPAARLSHLRAVWRVDARRLIGCGRVGGTSNSTQQRRKQRARSCTAVTRAGSANDASRCAAGCCTTSSPRWGTASPSSVRRCSCAGREGGQGGAGWGQRARESALAPPPQVIDARRPPPRAAAPPLVQRTPSPWKPASPAPPGSTTPTPAGGARWPRHRRPRGRGGERGLTPGTRPAQTQSGVRGRGAPSAGLRSVCRDPRACPCPVGGRCATGADREEGSGGPSSAAQGAPSARRRTHAAQRPCVCVPVCLTHQYFQHDTRSSEGGEGGMKCSGAFLERQQTGRGGGGSSGGSARMRVCVGGSFIRSEMGGQRGGRGGRVSAQHHACTVNAAAWQQRCR